MSKSRIHLQIDILAICIGTRDGTADTFQTICDWELAKQFENRIETGEYQQYRIFTSEVAAHLQRREQYGHQAQSKK